LIYFGQFVRFGGFTMHKILVEVCYGVTGRFDSDLFVGRVSESYGKFCWTLVSDDLEYAYSDRAANPSEAALALQQHATRLGLRSWDDC
jgi:hypothetical protein